jgi:hypothetical protein
LEPFIDIPTATAAIEAHDACAQLVTLPNAYVVYYPPAYVIPGGTMVQRTGNDLASLNLLYASMDNWWNAQRLQIAAP